MSQRVRNQISTIGFVVVVLALIILISYFAASNGLLGPGLRAAVGASRLSVAGSCSGTRNVFTITNNGSSTVGAGYSYALSDSTGKLLESGQVNLAPGASTTVTPPSGGTQPYTLQVTKNGNTVAQAEKSCP
jgi:archaellum component FlaF (FlaF/FlaG flagellin family)